MTRNGLFLIGLMISSRVYAAAPTTATAPSRDIVIDLPRSTMMSSNTVFSEMNFSDPRRGSIEAGLSSWATRELDPRRSRAPNERAGWNPLPALNLNYVSAPLLSGQAGVLSLKTGLSVLTMTRDESTTVNGITRSETERANLIPTRFGVQLDPAIGRISIFSPYLSASVLPTLGLFPASAFSEGSVDTGLGIELAGGYSASMPARSWISRINAGAVWTRGRLRDSSLNGLGVSASASVSL